MDDKNLQKAKGILQLIANNGGEARFVGGAVRDFLSGRKVEEVDIACNLEPAEVQNIFKQNDYKTIPTGIDFGTITIIYEGEKYEITSLRSDLNCDGRHAKVRFTKNFEEDSKRRDFTINALYMDVEGEIYDFHNGIEDLKHGHLKFIGDASERIKEDYLRILRYFRFLSYFGNISNESADLKACIQLKQGLENISGERIRHESFKMLNGKFCTEVLKLLKERQLFELLFDINSKQANLSYFEQSELELNHPTLKILSLANSNDFEEEALKIATKIKFTKEEKRDLDKLIKGLKIDFYDSYQVNNFIRKSGKASFLNSINFLYLRGTLDKSKFAELVKYCDDFVTQEPPIKAEDLIKLGAKQGKELGKLLKRAEEIWERSNYNLNKPEILVQLELPTN